MSIKSAAVVLWAAVMVASAAHSQSVSQIGGPKELPPPGYKAMQYIDSRGCVFLRAGLGGTVTWVPRVGQNRKVLCGYPPTLGTRPVETAAAEPPVQKVPVAEPMAEPVAPRVMAAAPAAAAPARMAAPVRPAAQPIRLTDYVPPPARTGQVIPTQGVATLPRPAQAGSLVTAVRPGVSVAAAEGQVGCPASAPRLQRLALTNGGTVLVCTPGDGSIRNLRPPVFAQGAGVGAALSDGPSARAVTAAVAPVRVAEQAAPVRRQSGAQAERQAAGGVRLATATVAAPAGYEPVWEDDRLNPLRGVGTLQGQAMQDQVWTRKIPAGLVGDTRKARRDAARERMSGAVLTVSSMSAPSAGGGAEAPVAARQGAYYVQAGSFGVPANAQGALARLAAAGLPVATGRAKGLTLVMAGPFASAGEAAAARAVVRGAGFADAFVR